MDANLFRAALPEIVRRLATARLDGVWSPVAGDWTFGFYGVLDGRAGKFHLFFRERPFLLFLSAHKPANPASPPAEAMRLRKWLRNGRVGGVRGHWPTRRLLIEFTGSEERRLRWLLLRPGEPPRLLDAPPQDMLTGVEPAGPALSEDDLLTLARDPVATPDGPPWLTRTVVRLLKDMTLPERLRAIGGLARGEVRPWVRELPDGAVEMSPWPPSGVALADAPLVPPEGGARVLELAERAGLGAACARREQLAQAPELARRKAGRKRLTRALENVARDAQRMRGLTELGAQGEALKAALWRLEGAPVPARASLPAPGDPESTVTVELDPRLSWAGNLERLFRLAAKGKRGLAALQGRAAAIRRELDTLDNPGDSVAPGRAVSAPDPAPRAPRAHGPSQVDERPPVRLTDPGFRLFRLAGGFFAARGRNAKANQMLSIRRAAPHDLWLHVEGGPGAHVVVARRHAGEEVPREALMQAAALAALSSWRSGDGRAEVMVAEARRVRPVKGGAPGQVLVAERLATLAVALDPELEARLAWPRPGLLVDGSRQSD